MRVCWGFRKGKKESRSSCTMTVIFYKDDNRKFCYENHLGKKYAVKYFRHASACKRATAFVYVDSESRNETN